MGLNGIYGSHTQEACPQYNEESIKHLLRVAPLCNEESRKHLLRVAPTMAKDAEKNNVKILNQFHSALERTFLWVAEAENPHIIEEIMARTGGRLTH
jgi:hypothetical protein